MIKLGSMPFVFSMLYLVAISECDFWGFPLLSRLIANLFRL